MKNYSTLIVFILLSTYTIAQKPITVGAERVAEYIALLKNKNVAIVANPTSMVGSTHLVDTLLRLGVTIKKAFCPEHGFRGTADAGENIGNYKDAKTGLPIISLYGKQYKPQPKDLKDIDIVVFDIQDVGVRFYTYISTMHYVMEACAENNKTLIILDRPNPNGFYVDGPVLDMAYKSFVGMHPIPIVHGCTIGELAQMINGEKWLQNKVQCKLQVITCNNYKHEYYYALPVKPSPNLASMEAVYLYPSLCLFEGTPISVGRGTTQAFEVYGHPSFKNYRYHFTPVSIANASKNPPYENKVCNGFELKTFANSFIKSYNKLYLYWLDDAYQQYAVKDSFFNPFFNKLAGNNILQEQVKKGVGEESIRQSWEPQLQQYKDMRMKYLLYN
ncbi:MAG: DUF1343 domain-containing protein [Bacteroidia bacterium]|nr:DUF1343 domain-containing protein [Bacteroidia bacterium]